MKDALVVTGFALFIGGAGSLSVPVGVMLLGAGLFGLGIRIHILSGAKNDS